MIPINVCECVRKQGENGKKRHVLPTLAALFVLHVLRAIRSVLFRRFVQHVLYMCELYGLRHQ